MLGSLAQRERRPLWITLSIVLSAGIGLALWSAANARTEATREAATDARLTAQTELAPLLQPADLMGPIVGDRATDLGDGIERSITKLTSIDEVRIYSSIGRVLFDEEPRLVGTRPSYLRNLTFEVANGSSRSQVRAGLLQTYVPIWLNPEGEVVVAEMSQPYDPIAAQASAPWARIALTCLGLLLGTLSLAVASSRTPVRRELGVQVYGHAGAASNAASATNRAPTTNGPAYQQSGFRRIEEQRQAAEQRASVAEESNRAMKTRLREALAQVKDLEGRLAMNDMQSTTTGGELQALRDQLKDTAERLHKAELDNNALRERLALRQHELDDVKQRAAAIRTDTDFGELEQRLQVAERRATEMGREMEKLENELDYTKAKFHMSKLSEALREFDNDDIEIDEQDDLFEHPVIIRSSGLAAPGKVR